MTEAAARAYVPVVRGNDLSEWIAPFGSVAANIDHDAHVLTIFANPKPHPADWERVCAIVQSLRIADIGEPVLVRGMETWVIRFDLVSPYIPH